MAIEKDYFLSKINRIQPLNPVMLDLLAELDNDESQVEDIQKIVQTDANTSATILKIANSPFYGMSGRINSVKDACVLLGYDQLKNIIYATAAELITAGASDVEMRAQLRIHTLAAATIADVIVVNTGLNKSYGYACGLLHELGKQVSLSEFPEMYQEFLLCSDEEEKISYLELFSDIGEHLAKAWKLSELIRSCVKYHCYPERSPEENRRYVQLVADSHSLAHCFGCTCPGETISQEIPILLEEYCGKSSVEEMIQKLEMALSAHPDLAACVKGG